MTTILSVEAASIAARWAMAVSGVIIGVNHFWMWRRDRFVRADRYQQTLLAYGVSIMLVFALPLITVSAGHYWVQLLEIVAGVASIAHAIASILYSEWLQVLTRWANGRSDQNTGQQG